MREIAVNVGKLSVRADWEKYFLICIIFRKNTLRNMLQKTRYFLNLFLNFESFSWKVNSFVGNPLEKRLSKVLPHVITVFLFAATAAFWVFQIILINCIR